MRPFDLLPLEQANPLIRVLEHFCQPSNFRALLEHPQAPSLRSVETLFEVSVQWLLSGLGFRAIWLHAFETLRTQTVKSIEGNDAKQVQDVKFKAPSVDCLAYRDSEDLLLLVNCTLAAPNPGELARYADLAAQLAKDFANSKIRIESVVFSASHTPETVNAGNFIAGIRVLYTDDIVRLLDAAVSGRPFRYGEFFGPFSHGWSM